ncbi:hypothetical protein [Acerihabitans sp.]|uniref:hypothetical protein n=1 Tax=Acerihabitans sp. TaxID=2811394 RepID=UPI002EDA6DC9
MRKTLTLPSAAKHVRHGILAFSPANNVRDGFCAFANEQVAPTFIIFPLSATVK